jgi:hypothetical protein
MKRTTTLTIETERVMVIRRRAAGRRARCATCGEAVTLVTAEEAAALTRVSTRAIYRMVEAEKLHFTETAEDLLLICFNSLCRSLLTSDTQSYGQFKSGRRKL